MTARTRWVWIAGCTAIGGTVALVAGAGMSRGYLFTGDTNHLLAGSRILLDCVHAHVFRACAFDPTRGQSQVGPYPLLQYLPALAMRGLGFSPIRVLRGLGWVNLAAFVVSLGLLASIAAQEHRRLWRPLLIVLAASGPMWFYASAGFGEMLAATVMLGAVVACIYRWPVPIALLALLACLGKETFAPFVLLLGLLAGRRDEDGWLPPARVLGPLGSGVIGGTLASLGFNLFRYGSVRNVRYLQPQLRVHGAARTATNVVDLYLAPGGGLAVFWPAVVLVLVAAAVLGVAAARTHDRQTAARVGALFVLLAAFTVGLALWWAPFGWIAWGPRLFVPLVPAFAAVTIHVGGGRLAGIVSRSLAHPVLFAGIAAVVVIGAFPEVSAPWVAGPAVVTLRATNSGCPPSATPGSPEYWRCFDHRAWLLHPGPLHTATTHTDGLTWAARIAALAGLSLLLAAARRTATHPHDGYATTATMSPEPTV